jgi:outer membrane receptor protein involved in Fe transport
MPSRTTLKHVLLCSGSAFVLTTAPAGLTTAAVAQDEQAESDVIVVTGTRRALSVQDVPLNIAAIGAAQIEEQGITELAEISNWIPGIHVVDQGGRGSDRIVVRGLNADPLGPSEGIANDGGGTVATYVGEIPLFVDLKLNDMDRVEVLLGPQGTLYGAGTLGGAVRYIPNRPQFDENTLQLRGDTYAYSEGDGLSTDFGLTANMALDPRLALRLSIDRLDDKGFIDYGFLVKEVGVSDPDPDFTDPADVAANLRREDDANTEETVSGKLALRWQPIDAVDANLTYYHQTKDVGSRQVSGRRTSVPAGDYESALRVLEPNKAVNDLVALEVVADLGFASLTSATGYSYFEEVGQRDQTDLLIGLEYSYELFPTFTAFTREVENDERINQELRLVSTHGGPLSWIVGGFYNKLDTYGSSKEFTPHYDEYLVDLGVGVQLRPDSLEYYSVSDTELQETAFFGEATYAVTSAWDLTFGARRYEYELTTLSAFDLPFFRTVFDGEDPESIILDFIETGQEDDGWLYKVNTSYDVTEDIMLYATLSEGYRIGDDNGVAACPDPLPPTQILCALPNETQFLPDKTLNHEIGARTQWMDGRLTLNGAVYYIDWKDPQVSSATVNGLIPITKNGAGAETKGFEVNFAFLASDALSLRGTYSYNQSELNALTENLVGFPAQENPCPKDPGTPTTYFTTCFVDGQPGDRLPGYPEHQGSIFAAYTQPIGGGLSLDGNVGVAYRSEVDSRTGGRGGGIVLDGYTVANAALGLSGDTWTLMLYADNLFDEYAETGVRSTPATVHPALFDDAGGRVNVRSHYTYILPPRQIGLRFTYDIGG